MSAQCGYRVRLLRSRNVVPVEFYKHVAPLEPLGLPIQMLRSRVEQFIETTMSESFLHLVLIIVINNFRELFEEAPPFSIVADVESVL